ncbi:MAG: CidA/LrgA family protein [Candidatus Competibacterales bacterium]|nr:CidA/LrgA family protein [Candidatus Competibacterales bacterium]
MLESLAALLVFQLIGETLVQLGALPLPGPVLGMALLFLALAWRGAVPEPLRRVCLTLLAHLSLLFVPAGVGVILYLPRIAREWWVILVALVLSTLAAIAVTALVMAWLGRRSGEHG